MAHTITRIEGFEWGGGTDVTNNPMFDGISSTTHNVVAAAARTGDFGLKITAAAGSTGHVQLAHSYLSTTGAQDSTTDFVAAAVRLYFRYTTLPIASAQIFSLKNAATTDVVRVDLDLFGQLGLAAGAGAATAGTTALTDNQWYRIEVLYDSSGGGTVTLKIDGTTELTGVNAGGGTNRLALGKATANGGTSGYTAHFDDIQIEAAAAASSIDYPGAGQVQRLDMDGDGFHDGTWIINGGGPATIPLALTHPHDGSTSYIVTPDTSSSKQTETLEATSVASITGTIAAAQFTSVAIRDTAGAAAIQLIGRASSTDYNLTSTTVTITVSYATYARCAQSHPAGGDWTAALLDGFEWGISYVASAGKPRVSTLVAQVAFAPGGSDASSSVILTQLDLLTGPLSVTNYSPKVKTVKITSEALGKPNEAFNVIAVSMRYVPWGAGTLRGVWNFDLLSTNSFTIPANPLEFGLLGTAGDSTFTFNQSTMVDGRQVYTYYREIGGSGKVFELYLDQTGSQHWEILALDLEVEPEGRREAYLGGDF